VTTSESCTDCERRPAEGVQGFPVIGRVERGFDFLGYLLTPDGLTLSRVTVARFVARAHLLYEQERGKPEGCLLLGAYVRRWVAWSRAGLAAPVC
jgi:hypothetical protein